MPSTKDDNPGVVERLGDISCSVFRSIVDDDHFPVLYGLVQNTPDAITNERSMLIGGAQHSYPGHDYRPRMAMEGTADQPLAKGRWRIFRRNRGLTRALERQCYWNGIQTPSRPEGKRIARLNDYRICGVAEIGRPNAGRGFQDHSTPSSF